GGRGDGGRRRGGGQGGPLHRFRCIGGAGRGRLGDLGQRIVDGVGLRQAATEASGPEGRRCGATVPLRSVGVALRRLDRSTPLGGCQAQSVGLDRRKGLRTPSLARALHGRHPGGVHAGRQIGWIPCAGEIGERGRRHLRGQLAGAERLGHPFGQRLAGLVVAPVVVGRVPRRGREDPAQVFRIERDGEEARLTLDGGYGATLYAGQGAFETLWRVEFRTHGRER